MPDPRWARALADLDDDPPPPDLRQAIADEITALWSDLEIAIREALGPGHWSMHCDWIAARIITLSRITAPARWQDIPTTLLLDGTYQALMRDAHLHVPQPDMAAIQRDHAARQ